MGKGGERRGEHVSNNNSNNNKLVRMRRHTAQETHQREHALYEAGIEPDAVWVVYDADFEDHLVWDRGMSVLVLVLCVGLGSMDLRRRRNDR